MHYMDKSQHQRSSQSQHSGRHQIFNLVLDVRSISHCLHQNGLISTLCLQQHRRHLRVIHGCLYFRVLQCSLPLLFRHLSRHIPLLNGHQRVPFRNDQVLHCAVNGLCCFECLQCFVVLFQTVIDVSLSNIRLNECRFQFDGCITIRHGRIPSHQFTKTRGSITVNLVIFGIPLQCLSVFGNGITKFAVFKECISFILELLCQFGVQHRLHLLLCVPSLHFLDHLPQFIVLLLHQRLLVILQCL